MEDLLEQANEIQESLGRSYAVPDELDEADLEAGSHHCGCTRPTYVLTGSLELDALALEEEEEGPSYLADLNKAPDFIDEAPVESEVRAFPILPETHLTEHRHRNSQKRLRPQAESHSTHFARAGLHLGLYCYYAPSILLHCMITCNR